MKTKVIIIGAGYAGILCANRLEKQNEGVEVTIISEYPYFQERIRFHEIASQQKEKKIPIQNLLRKKINFVNGKVIEIVPKNNQVVLRSLVGNFTLDYDFLVVSIGSSGIKKQNDAEYSIQSLESLQNFLNNKNPDRIQNLCVLGGGLTGIELAVEWKEKYPNQVVTVIDKSPFAKSFSKTGKTYIHNKFKNLGIQIIDSIQIQSIGSEKIIFQNHKEIQYDSLINCTGFQIYPLLKESGFLTNDLNQVYVDPFLRSKQFQNVFVAGDAAKLEHSILRMGCVTALPMGAYVADVLSNTIKNKDLSPFSFQFFGRCVSLGRKDGLIQWTYGDDTPKEWVITGKLAALIKEIVNRFTIFSLKMEKYLPFRFYFWPKGSVYKLKNYEFGNGEIQSES
ncbi:NAD(P)/FAD-dependent oxidoreductase [Leptospira sp. WS39.C2]